VELRAFRDETEILLQNDCIGDKQIITAFPNAIPLHPMGYETEFLFFHIFTLHFFDNCELIICSERLKGVGECVNYQSRLN
jgi:hypothetical protein